MPEIDPDEIVTDRYLTVVDIGGRSNKADWSVITVFDRLFMSDGGKPVVVAQWYGHIDIDLLAWKAGQIAAFYDNSLLVIESNTLETHDKERQVDGDQSQFVLNQLEGCTRIFMLVPLPKIPLWRVNLSNMGFTPISTPNR